MAAVMVRKKEKEGEKCKNKRPRIARFEEKYEKDSQIAEKTRLNKKDAKTRISATWDRNA